MKLGGKMQGYAEGRALGLKPEDAGTHAGYSGAGLPVTVSRIEARADVQAEIRRLKRGGKRVDKTPDTAAEEVETEGRDGWTMKDKYESPLALMEDVMNNPKAPKSLRYQAAKDALPYRHARKEGGKREQDKEDAKKAGKGKFGTARQPGQRASLQ